MIEEILKEIHTLTTLLQYNSTLELVSEGKHDNMLLIDLNEACEVDEELCIIVVDDEDELDGCTLIQFFIEFSFELKALKNIYELCNFSNTGLNIGRFLVSEDGNKLYYKYIWAHAKNEKFSAEYLADIMDMVLFAVEENYKIFNPRH